MVKSLEEINSEIDLYYKQLNDIQLKMEQYSESNRPSTDHIVKYYVECGQLKEQIAYLKGVRDTINGLQT